MNRVSINNTGLNPFKRAEDTKVVQTNTNPFGISFKGSVLSADVFEKTAKPVKPAIKNIAKESIVEKGKLFASAIVGNLNNFHSSIKQKWNSFVDFGKKATQQVCEMWKKANEIDVKIPNIVTSFKERLADKGISSVVRELMEKPVPELSSMLKKGIAARV